MLDAVASSNILYGRLIDKSALASHRSCASRVEQKCSRLCSFKIENSFLGLVLIYEHWPAIPQNPYGRNILDFLSARQRRCRKEAIWIRRGCIDHGDSGAGFLLFLATLTMRTTVDSEQVHARMSWDFIPVFILLTRLFSITQKIAPTFAVRCEFGDKPYYQAEGVISPTQRTKF
jgi:hypothetical protein